MVNNLAPVEERLPDISSAEAIAANISTALKKASRQSRVPVSIVSGGGGFKARRIDVVVIRLILVLFVLLALLPSVVSGLYLGLIAADQYETEGRFIVNKAGQSGIDSLGPLSGLADSSQEKDAHLLKTYMQSRSIINALETNIGLRSRFTDSSKVDFWARLEDDAPLEDVQDYWKDHVSVKVDSRSTAVIFKVYAYSAQDSYEIAQEIVRLSEALINQLSERARRDAIVNAERKLERAQNNMLDISEKFQQARNQVGILDTDITAKANAELEKEIKGQIVLYRQRLSILQSSAATNSPQISQLKAQISNLETQLSELAAGRKAQNGSSVSQADAKKRFDQLEVQQKAAQSLYVAAVSEFEGAKAQADVMQVYLDLFLKPVEPEIALYPKRLLWWSYILVGSVLLWGILAGLVVLVRDHWAR